MNQNYAQNSIWEKWGISLFGLGVVTCTWDRFLSGGIAGFHVKLYLLFFSLSFVLALYLEGKNAVRSVAQSFKHGFAACIIILVVYYLARLPWSFFPLKTFLYSGWTVFNLLTIWVNASLWAKRFPRNFFYGALFAAISIQSIIIFIDQIAYRYGYTGGLIGVNQDKILLWGISRPSGFSAEPSYAATFLALGLLTLLPWVMAQKKWWIWLLSALQAYALIATTSRTGWALIPLGLAFAFYWEARAAGRIPWKKLGVAVSALTAITFIYIYTMPEKQKDSLMLNMVNSFHNGKGDTGITRIRAHYYAWQMAHDTSFLGTGLGASWWYWVNTHQRDQLGDNPNLTPDRYGNEAVMSTWGQLLAEAGIFGPLLYALAGFFLWRSLYRQWREKPSAFVSFSMAACAAFFLFGAFWLGNIARADIWIWYALWSHIPFQKDCQVAAV